MKYNFIVNETAPLILILESWNIKMETIKIHFGDNAFVNGEQNTSALSLYGN